MNDREFIALENQFKDELEKFKDACQAFGVEPSARITDCLLNFEIYLNSHPIQSSIAHPDDLAIDNFAQAMKEKMAKQRAKDYSGWNDKSACSEQKLQGQLLHHIAKGDPVDVGNFAMMLFNRGENTNNHLCAEKLLELYGDNMALHENSAGLKEFLLNLQRSRNKYPLNNRMFDGLLGELAELRRAYGGDGDVRSEALDVAVCAFRIAVEGDTGGNTLLEA